MSNKYSPVELKTVLQVAFSASWPTEKQSSSVKTARRSPFLVPRTQEVSNCQRLQSELLSLRTAWLEREELIAHFRELLSGITLGIGAAEHFDEQNIFSDSARRTIQYMACVKLRLCLS